MSGRKKGGGWWIGAVGLTLALLTGFVSLSVRRAGGSLGQVLELATINQQRMMAVYAEGVLAHLASLPSVKQLAPGACREFAMDWRDGKGQFVVIALGNANGTAVCTADPGVEGPLPTMADRLYYQRAMTADGLVVGEYAISRTTGKPTLHYAYPVFSEAGERVGLVMAGMDLAWFESEELGAAFRKTGMRLAWLDRNGKVLKAYPPEQFVEGESPLDVGLLSKIAYGDGRPFVWRDGECKLWIYAFRVLGGESEREGELYLLAGFRMAFLYPIYLAGLVAVAVVTAYGYYWGRRRGR